MPIVVGLNLGDLKNPRVQATPQTNELHPSGVGQGINTFRTLQVTPAKHQCTRPSEHWGDHRSYKSGVQDCNSSSVTDFLQVTIASMALVPSQETQ